MTTAINLSGLTERSSAKTKKDKPTLQVEAELVDTFVSHKAESKKAEGQLDASKTHLLMACAENFFRLNNQLAMQGREIASTAQMNGNIGTARITLANMYSLANSEDLTQHGYGNLIEEGHFAQRFDIKIDGEQIPLAHRQEFVDGIKELVDRCEAGNAVTCKAGFAPVATFHQERFRLLTPESNLGLQSICPARLYVA